MIEDYLRGKSRSTYYQNVSSQNLSITFYNYKHSYGHIPISFLITPQPNKSCPFTNLSLYVSLRGLTPCPLFCFPGGHSVSRLAFMLRFNQSLNLIGLDPKIYKGHSFRIGKATELALSGIPDHEIQGSWGRMVLVSFYQIHKDSKHLIVNVGISLIAHWYKSSMLLSGLAEFNLLVRLNLFK